MSRKKKKKRQRPSSVTRGSVAQGVPVNDRLIDIESQLDRALQYHRSGELKNAEKIYRKILKIDPNHSDCLDLLGLVAHKLGKSDVAVNLINKAIQNNPDNAVYFNDLGDVFRDKGRLSEAISCYEKAIQFGLDSSILPGLYNNMGNAFKDQGKSGKAVSCYQKAIQLGPDLALLPGLHNNLGNAFEDQGRFDEAVSHYQKALQIRPNHAQAHNNMGVACQNQGKLEEAVSCFQTAVKLHPNFAEAYNNMGIAFQDRGNLDKAIFCFQKCVQLEPSYAEAWSNLVFPIQQTYAWHEFEGLTAKLNGLTKKALDHGIKPAETPFTSLTRSTDLSLNCAIAGSWSADIARTMSNMNIDFSFEGRSSRKRKVVVGYLSNDFCNHATAHLMLSLFGVHSRNEFDIFCYSYGKDDGSYYRRRIKQDCDKFVDVQNLSYADAAECIYEDQVDILVDLKGYTKGNRLAICALRPAPVQVSYLGFPGTVGAEFFDYIVTDRIVTPEDHAAHYSENFVCLPHCYQVNDHTQSISGKDWKKADFGLPKAGFVFCSFNLAYKIDPIMFDVWMKVLSQVPQGVLWLQWANETAEKNLRQEAEARGVEAERLIFAQNLPKAEHLARMTLADLALDTRIVNGHTTTSDVLWAGVPVITLMGSHFASRVSASILTAIGLPELITHGLENYEALAVKLATHPGELDTIRQKLAKNRLIEPLFDTPRFAWNLEKAYKEMWKIFLAGEPPRQIEVRDSQS